MRESALTTRPTGTTGLPLRPLSSDGWPVLASLIPLPLHSVGNPIGLHYRSAQATRRFARPSLPFRVPLSLQGGGGMECKVFEVSGFSGLFSQPEWGESALAAC
jgi:hypothetical protein